MKVSLRGLAYYGAFIGAISVGNVALYVQSNYYNAHNSGLRREAAADELAAALARERAAKDELRRAVLSHSEEEIRRANIVSQGALLDRMGIKVRPSYE